MQSSCRCRYASIAGDKTGRPASRCASHSNDENVERIAVEKFGHLHGLWTKFPPHIDAHMFFDIRVKYVVAG